MMSTSNLHNVSSSKRLKQASYRQQPHERSRSEIMTPTIQVNDQEIGGAENNDTVKDELNEN